MQGAKVSATTSARCKRSVRPQVQGANGQCDHKCKVQTVRSSRTGWSRKHATSTTTTTTNRIRVSVQFWIGLFSLFSQEKPLANDYNTKYPKNCIEDKNKEKDEMLLGTLHLFHALKRHPFNLCTQWTSSCLVSTCWMVHSNVNYFKST